ncbi:MAG: hypothetical protein RL059_1095 [Bacteroidota bacterium]
MTTEAVDINWQATDIVSFLPLMLSLVFFSIVIKALSHSIKMN